MPDQFMKQNMYWMHHKLKIPTEFLKNISSSSTSDVAHAAYANYA